MLDEDVQVALAKALRRRGHDVVHVRKYFWFTLVDPVEPCCILIGLCHVSSVLFGDALTYAFQACHFISPRYLEVVQHPLASDTDPLNPYAVATQLYESLIDSHSASPS